MSHLDGLVGLAFSTEMMSSQTAEDGLVLELLKTNLANKRPIYWKLQVKLHIYRTLRDQLSLLLLKAIVLLLQISDLGSHGFTDQVN